MKIAVLLGGTSAERYVSMASGKGIAEALLERGHDVHLYDVALGTDSEIAFEDLVLPTEIAPSPEDLARFSHAAVVDAIRNLPDDIDVAFVALHGTDGEDGRVQAVLELCDVPYTGSGVLASALAMNKLKSKELFRQAGIPTPRAFLRTAADSVTADELQAVVARETDYPVVVKPNDGGSTVGLTIVDDPSELIPAFHLALKYSRQVLFEEYVPGKELTVTVLRDDALPALEIRPKEGFYDYTNKYTAGKTEYLCPAPVSLALSEEMQTLALRAHSVIGCEGYSRVDFRLDENDALWCLEVNTLPGMTGTSLVPKAAAAVGMSYPELCEAIVQEAVARSAIAGSGTD